MNTRTLPRLEAASKHGRPAPLCSRAFRLADRDVGIYSDAVGDRNPLHVDEDFARRSPYGRPIAHGALVLTLALAVLFETTDPRALEQIRVTFRQPVLPGRRYEINWTRADGGAVRGRVSFGGVEVVGIHCTFGPGLRFSEHTVRPRPHRPRPRLFDPADPPGLEQGSYAADHRFIAKLTERLVGGRVPEHIATLLGWVSYWTGMSTPGRDALLVACTIDLQQAGFGALEFHTDAAEVDRRSGLVTLRAHTRCGVNADVTVQSLVREQVPAPNPDSLAEFVPPSDLLADRTILVVGGSRGLGAAVSLGLAAQGATVLVSCSRPPTQLLAAAGPYRDRLKLVLADARNPHALAAALPAIPLDGVVVPAAPAIPSLPLAPDAVDCAADFIGDSARLVLAPLSVCATRLRPYATVVLVSSAAVDDPPRWWAHYTAAKCATEALARYAAEHHPWQVAVVRPPRLWTDLTNTPGGRAASAPMGPVAAAIVGAFTAPDFAPGEVAVLESRVTESGQPDHSIAPTTSVETPATSVETVPATSVEEVRHAGNSGAEQVLR
ncbi:SDR family NAD(P)-dependent oxidoreductase [Nocardia sp. NPDC088792]|uniref:SDR family NAD(P)-dependent oxidoreductase n=1 Tax=Nocardia sp. NPDC088792 TaxID=3364332 RepID=UPI003800E87D